MKFEIKKQKILYHFDRDNAETHTIIKSGWRDMYYIIFEDGAYEEFDVKIMSADSLLKTYDEITENDLKKLDYD